MPNFNTHWLIAWQAAGAGPSWLAAGREAYRSGLTKYKSDIDASIKDITSIDKASTLLVSIQSATTRFYNKALETASDDVVAFSAYMCGACGPDFWTLPQGHFGNTVGTLHFDLGHYNRTHAQFLTSIRRLHGEPKTSLQSKVEAAYYMGMATHIAADLIMHQLVNRSAGAYNLLSHGWRNENGAFFHALWSTHNKVEHYWDSYLRLRYLGNYEALFEEPKGPWFEPLGFPVAPVIHREFTENHELRASIAGHPEGLIALQCLDDLLKTDAFAAALEQPMIFPQLFADHLLNGEIRPFIYAVTLDKAAGAYPEAVSPEEVTKEAKSKDFIYKKRKPSELHKAAYFSSERNKKISTDSYNYLNYIVCPNLQQVKQFGHNIFFAFNALEPFLRRAVAQAQLFLREVDSAYASNSPRSLNHVGRFWNLDTGLGLRVVRKPSLTEKEAITQLDFVHVLESAGGGRDAPVDFKGGYHYLQGKPIKHWERSEIHAFPVFSSDSTEIPVEEGTAKFLDHLPHIRNTLNPPTSHLSIDDDLFFAIPQSPIQKKKSIFSSFFTQKKNSLTLSEIAHRLNLEIRVPIAHLGDEVGVFFQGDQAGIRPPCKKKPAEWLPNAQMLDLSEKGSSASSKLKVFATRLFVNLEQDPHLKTASSSWNGVIPYDSYKEAYGRNFVISTGRSWVLHSTAWSKNFDGVKDFEVYKNVSPTEQVFFSLYTLVRTPDGIFDAFSKKKIKKAEMTEIRRIESVGFVKIVLFYELTDRGACQLNECYIDGLRAPVEDQ